MRIVFVYPKWTQECGFSSHFAKRALFPPLNLALLAALAEEEGHEVCIVDAESDNLDAHKVVNKINDLQPDIVACTGMSTFFHLSEQLCSEIKKYMPHITTIVGGQHITILKEKAFSDCFDYAFIGECENTFGEFLTRLEEGGDVSEIKGILYRKNGEVKYTGMCDYVEDLDELPWANRELLPYEKYKIGTLKGRLNFTTIQTIRGCPWQCIFCHSKELNSALIRKRSPESVLDEIQCVIHELDIYHFIILDDVLTMDRKHIEAICHGIIGRDLGITFEGSTRANLIDDRLIKLMKKAGLVRMSLGLETVDAEMRDIIKKKIPLEAYSKANKILNENGIEVANSVMLGLPGETPETIKKTFNFLKKDRNVKQANIAIAMPYPGTKFFNMAKNGEHGMELLTQDFSKYRRYGSSVVSINGMTPQDLLDYQNEGFVSVYSAPWRWKSMIKKNGVVGGLLMLIRVFNLLIKKVFNGQPYGLERTS